jgi:polysaccharide biosynthesis transport protein
MEVTGLLSMLRRWFPVIMLVVALAAAASYVAATRSSPSYESRVRLLVGPLNADSGTLKASEILTRTYGDLVTSEFVLNGTIERLDLPTTSAALSSAVRPTVDTATRLMIVRVLDDDPHRSAAIANEIANQLSRLASQGTVRPEGEITVVDSATTGMRVGQSPVLIMLVGAFGGALVAITAALLIEYLRNAVTGEEELAEITGAPYLGHVPTPRLQLGPPGELVFRTQPGSTQADAYRLLATKLRLGDLAGPGRSMAVLPTRRAQGSAELAANVAAALQQQDLRVVLVDTDDSGVASSLLGCRGRRGLGELLAHHAQGELRDEAVLRLCRLHASGFAVLPSGTRTTPPTVMAARRLLDVLLTSYDMVVISLPPLTRSAAALSWANAASTALLMARRARTGRTELRETVTSLQLVECTLAGAVFEQRIWRWRRRSRALARPRTTPRPLGPETRSGAPKTRQWADTTTPSP